MDKYISLRTFLITSGVLGGIILLVLVLIIWNAETTRVALNKKFPEQDVPIDFGGKDRNIQETDEDKGIRIPVARQDRKDGAQYSSASQRDIQMPPVEGLHRKGPKGNMLPVRRADGLTAFQAYAKPAVAHKNKKKIALVLVDFGLSQRAMDTIFEKLPPDITLALSPYANSPGGAVKTAIQKGYETWLSLPLQSAGYPQSDTGPNTLLTRVTLEANRFRLYHTLGATAGYPGVIVTDTTQFLDNKANVNNLVKELGKRGLGFAFSQTDTNSVVVSTILDEDLPVAQNNLWLDKPPTPEHIDNRLQTLNRIAAENSRAIAFFHPYPSSLNKIADWIKKHAGDDFQLVPLSYFARN